MNKDFTVGKPSSLLWRFCLPLFASIIFQQLYTIADSLVVGKFVGETAFAAVGNSYTITLLLLAFAFGCNIGCSVVVSHLFGAKDFPQMKTAVYTTFISSGILCAVLMIASGLGCNLLLQAIQTPAALMNDSKIYLNIYIYGLPFLFYYNISTGVFSALGDSRTPFLFLACSSVANIIVDVVFVKVCNMGVAGVAWATFLCQGVSCVLALIVVLRRLQAFHTTEPVQKFSWPLFRRISAIAIPSTLQQSFISVGNIVIQGVINSFGSSVIAGYSASVKLNNLVITSLTTVGNGISNYTGQNLGAKKPERVRAGFFAGLKMVWIICVPIILLYFFGSRVLVNAFIDQPTAGAITSGVQFLRILSPFYFVIAAKLVADGILRGAGKMRSFMICTFSDLFLRVLLAFLLSKAMHDSLGIWLSWPIGWTVGMIISVLFNVKAPWWKHREPVE